MSHDQEVTHAQESPFPGTGLGLRVRGPYFGSASASLSPVALIEPGPLWALVTLYVQWEWGTQAGWCLGARQL